MFNNKPREWVQGLLSLAFWKKEMEKKKILVIDNSAISVDDNGFYINAFNGDFVSELQQIGNHVSYLQFRADKKSELSSFNLKKACIDVILM